MILIICLSCGFSLQVQPAVDPQLQGELDTLVGEKSEYWPDKYKCPECNAAARGCLPHQITAAVSSKIRVVEVNPMEALMALEGLGLPSERSCMLSDVGETLKVGVKRAVGKDIAGTSRCIVDYLELTDGSKVYLGASTEGATVYRITRSRSYVMDAKVPNG